MEMLDGRKLNYGAPKKLEGIHGMLKFVCIYLTLIGPFLLSYSIYSSITRSSNDSIPAGLIFMIALNVLDGGFSFVAGVTLWSKKSVGLVLAKVYLMVHGSMAVANFILTIISVAGSDASAGSNSFQVMISIFLIGVGAPVLFFIYLFKSQRVKNTFPPKTRASAKAPEGQAEVKPEAGNN